jgi:uncharacterized membrane protein YdbT with pleckstrin-like domain
MQDIQIAKIDLFEHDDDEKILGEVQRHPFGVYTRAFGALFVVVIITGFGLLLNSFELSGDPLTAYDANLSLTDYLPWIILLIGGMVTLGTAASIYVYRNNYLVLTDQKLVFVRTHSLFSRSVSQLSIGDVQDATIEQTSIFSRLFDFGTIKIETAGEMDNFSFHYAKDPVYTAKCIVDAHEENLKLYGN